MSVTSTTDRSDGSCPSIEDLASLVNGAVESIPASELRRHVERCTPCLAAVAELAVDPGTMTARAGGRYELYEVLGAGSFGRVRRGWDATLEREVAVKLYREHVPVRALAEARALAQLQHPNVVTVYDVGANEDGAFLAMELVTGQTLREWHRPPRRAAEIRRVLADAARGLAAAHARGIVHRDIKPDNIIIDRRERVVVVDFGLATTVGVEAGASAASVAGSPAYMAPEVRRGEASSAASDVFAFCVTACESFTGHRPRVITEGGQGALSLDIPRSLRPLLRRGLSAEAADRPPIEQFIAKLAPRWGAGRSMVIGSVLAVAGWQWSTADGDPCADAERAMAGSWNDVRREEVVDAFARSGLPFAATASRRTVDTLDRYASGWVVARTDVCRAARLDPPSSAQQHKLQSQCLRRAKVGLDATVDALTHANPTLVTDAHRALEHLPPLARCADVETLLAQAVPDADAGSSDNDVAIAVARVKLDAREFDAALASLARVADPGVVQQIEIAQIRGLVEQRRDSSFAEAEVAFREALELALAHDQRELAVISATRLAFVVLLQGRTGEAVGQFVAVESLLDERISLDTRALAHIIHSFVLQDQLKHNEAEAESVRAIELAVQAGDHRRVAMYRGEHADHLNTLGRFDEAQTEVERSIRTLTRELGALHPDVAQQAVRLAMALTGQGRMTEAEEVRLAHLHTVTELYGNDHLAVAVAYRALGSHYSMTGQSNLSEEYLRASVDTARGLFGDESPTTLSFRLFWARSLVAVGRAAQSREELEAVLEAVAAYPGDTMIDPVHVRFALADAMEAMGDIDAALALVESQMEAAVGMGLDGPVGVPVAYFARGDLLFQHQRFADAAADFQRAIDGLRPVLGERSIAVAEIEGHLAMTLLALGSESEAKSLALEALAAFDPDERTDRLVRVPVMVALGVARRGEAEGQKVLRDVVQQLRATGTERKPLLWIAEAALRSPATDAKALVSEALSLGEPAVDAGP